MKYIIELLHRNEYEQSLGPLQADRPIQALRRSLENIHFDGNGRKAIILNEEGDVFTYALRPQRGPMREYYDTEKLNSQERAVSKQKAKDIMDGVTRYTS